jgi:hypothetical protein
MAAYLYVAIPRVFSNLVHLLVVQLKETFSTPCNSPASSFSSPLPWSWQADPPYGNAMVVLQTNWRHSIWAMVMVISPLVTST